MTTAARVSAPVAKAPAVAPKVAPSRIFRQCECGATCSSCATDDEKIMRQALPGLVPSAIGLPVSQPGDADEVAADARASSALARSPSAGPLAPTIAGSGGEPLSGRLRAFFEPRFGHDLGAVRVHTDGRAAESATQLHARAFTIGGDIHFGRGQFEPASDSGKRLIAHELAHVVHQGAAPAQIRRAACPHDTDKGSGCGVFDVKGLDNAIDDFVATPNDRIIAATLPEHLGGKWIPQLLSPPNLAKTGTQRGFVDAAKVTTGSALAVEVLEIKSRNTTNGGCTLASSETSGYVAALNPLAPHIIKLSAGLAKAGGLVVDQCRNLNKAQGATLVSAGLDVKNPLSVYAWCTYNSLQKKLGTTFTTPFTSVTFSTNKDGTPGKDYVVGIIPITCKKGTKTVPGTKTFVFQVNGAGGLSYRCDKKCGDQDKDQDKKPVEKTLEIPDAKGVKHAVQDISGEDDYDPADDGKQLPPEGVPVTDIAIYTAAGVATIATIHKLLRDKATSEAEKALLREAGKRTLAQLEKEGAYQVARTLNGANAAKWGTEAGEAVLLKGEQLAAEKIALTTEKQIAERLALQMEKKAAGELAKTIFKGAARAIPIVIIAFAAKDAIAGVIQLSRGAELHIGLPTGSETDLGSGTDVKIAGDKATNDKVVQTADLDNTKIDIEVAKAPDVKGVMDLTTSNVSISGKVDGKDGDPAIVNMKVKISDTTIVITSVGTWKGGNVVVDGGLDISNSTIEIDIPKGAVPPASTTGGKTVKITGAKVKVTKFGNGTGTGDKTAGAGTGTGTDKNPDAAKDPVTEKQKQLVTQIKADPNVKKVYDAIIAKKGAKLSEEALARLLAIKEALAKNPALADRIIKSLTTGEVTDPIKELIEPMEAEIKKAADEEKAKTSPPPPPPPNTATTSTKTPAVTPTPSSTTSTTTSTGSDPCATAYKLDFWGLVADKPNKPADVGVSYKRQTLKGVDSPPDEAKVTVIISRKTSSGNRTYRVTIVGQKTRDLKPAEVDKSKFYWAAMYTFAAPGYVVLSDSSDLPICFDDAGTTMTRVWGAEK